MYRSGDVIEGLSEADAEVLASAGAIERQDDPEPVQEAEPEQTSEPEQAAEPEPEPRPKRQRKRQA